MSFVTFAVAHATANGAYLTVPNVFYAVALLRCAAVQGEDTVGCFSTVTAPTRAHMPAAEIEIGEEEH